eukprot:15479143-Alexandrium_andersonii.AAC.1
MSLPGGLCPAGHPQEAPPVRPMLASWAESASVRTNAAECTHPELPGSIPRQFLGPRSSSFERLKQLRTF